MWNPLVLVPIKWVILQQQSTTTNNYLASEIRNGGISKSNIFYKVYKEIYKYG